MIKKMERTHDIEGARALEDGTKDISIAGRILSKRKMGKISFIHIGDITGKIQLVIKRDDLGEESIMVATGISLEDIHNL